MGHISGVHVSGACVENGSFHRIVVGSFFGVAGHFSPSLSDWRRVQRSLCARRLHSLGTTWRGVNVVGVKGVQGVGYPKSTPFLRFPRD